MICKIGMDITRNQQRNPRANTKLIRMKKRNNLKKQFYAACLHDEGF